MIFNAVSIQAIDADGVIVEQFHLLLIGARRDDLPQSSCPLSIAGTQCADGPVAAEHDPIWAEGVETMIDGWR